MNADALAVVRGDERVVPDSVTVHHNQSLTTFATSLSSALIKEAAFLARLCRVRRRRLHDRVKVKVVERRDALSRLA